MIRLFIIILVLLFPSAALAQLQGDEHKAKAHANAKPGTAKQIMICDSRDSGDAGCPEMDIFTFTTTPHAAYIWVERQTTCAAGFTIAVKGSGSSGGQNTNLGTINPDSNPFFFFTTAVPPFLTFVFATHAACVDVDAYIFFDPRPS